MARHMDRPTDTLLTTENPTEDYDAALFSRLGLRSQELGSP